MIATTSQYLNVDATDNPFFNIMLNLSLWIFVILVASKFTNIIKSVASKLFCAINYRCVLAGSMGGLVICILKNR